MICKNIEDVRDPDGLEELGAGGVVVAAEEEELLEDLRRERGVLLPRPRRRRRGRAVAADAAHLPLLVLVVVPADPARVLALTLPHLSRPPPPPRIREERKRGRSNRELVTLGGAEMEERGGIFFYFQMMREMRGREIGAQIVRDYSSVPAMMLFKLHTYICFAENQL